MAFSTLTLLIDHQKESQHHVASAAVTKMMTMESSATMVTGFH